MTSPVPHQALYRRWRAQTFSQIVGQEAVVETLRNAVRTDRVSHALLFVGPRGTGKTSLARIVAKAVNCTDLRDGDPCDACLSCTSIRESRAFDLVEIDAASNRGIDAVRELRERIHYPPSDLKRKVYILDEAHQITKDAWNALLKSLEEPPPFVVFMFASTEPSGFPPAILSRLQRYDVRRLTVGEIEGKLARILKADGREAEPAAIRLIARLAAGGMRDAESMLDQLLSSGEARIDEARVRSLLGLADADAVDAFVDALVSSDPATGIRLLDSLEERGRDTRSFLDQVVETLRAELMQAITEPATARRSSEVLAAAARRIAAIDPDRAGIGGLRLQLELALFAARPLDATPRQPAGRVVTATPVVSEPPAERPTARQAPDPARAAAQATPQPSSRSAPVAARRVETPASTAAPTGDAGSDAPALEAAGTPEGADPAPLASGTPEAPTAPDRTADPAAIPGAAPASDGLSALLAAWPSIVARVSQHPPTKPLIVACRPVAVEGNIVTLGFPEEQAFLKDVAERKRTQIEQGIGESLGHAVSVRCVVANVELAATSPGTDEAFVMAEARRIFADDLADVQEVT